MVYWYVWIDRKTTSLLIRLLQPIVAFNGMHNSWTSIHPRTVKKKTKHLTITPEETPMAWFDGASQSNGMQSDTGGVCFRPYTHLQT
jgi:hypothetical protein